MPESIEREPRAPAVMAETLAVQSGQASLPVHAHTFADVLSNNERSLRNVSRALKARPNAAQRFGS